jgi:hypothetical protein
MNSVAINVNVQVSLLYGDLASLEYANKLWHTHITEYYATKSSNIVEVYSLVQKNLPHILKRIKL